MPNQREIAKELGLSQYAVSLALRGDPSISAATRERVRAKAAEMGYRPNPYVNTLMSHIRQGRRPGDKGAIGVVIDVFREKEWLAHESYRVYHRGLERRAEQLGFHLERFCLAEPGVSAAKVDKVLHARGIRGLILAPPYFGNRRLAFSWERYACVGTGYSWEEQQFDRVAHDHDQNAVRAIRELRALGYRRIGLVLPPFYAEGRGTRWLDGYLACQHCQPPEECVPLLVADPAESSVELRRFQEWLREWRPEAVLCLYGHELEALSELGLRVPEDLGLACLIRPEGSDLAGVDDRFELIGEAAVELVASKIAFNQYGVPADAKLLLIEGRWVPGGSAIGIARMPSEIIVEDSDLD